MPSSPNVVSSSRFHRLRSTVSSLSHSALGNVQTCVDSVGSVGSTGHLMGLDPESFEHLYPFHFALDLDFKVLQAGDALRRILPQMGVPGTPIHDILTVSHWGRGGGGRGVGGRKRGRGLGRGGLGGGEGATWLLPL